MLLVESWQNFSGARSHWGLFEPVSRKMMEVLLIIWGWDLVNFGYRKGDTDEHTGCGLLKSQEWILMQSWESSSLICLRISGFPLALVSYPLCMCCSCSVPLFWDAITQCLWLLWPRTPQIHSSDPPTLKMLVLVSEVVVGVEVSRIFYYQC